MATTAKTHKCPECGRKFSRPQSLGIHRRNEHGVIGGSAAAARARARRSANATSAKRTTTARAAAKRTTAKRSTAKRATAKRSTTKRATAKSTTMKRWTVKRATAKRASAVRAAQRNGAPPSMATGLLAIVFPNGFPANEQVLRETIAWLGEAERLAALA